MTSRASEAMAERRAERRRLGLCAICGNEPHSPDMVTCIGCRARVRENMRRLRSGRRMKP
jgi:hypothetical protein